MATCKKIVNSKTCRLSSMLALTFSFFLVELVVGHVTHSLALVGDSYHMLSDVVALVVGLASLRISKLRSQKNTYGWARAEVVGALINSVFLIALSFTIFVEAIERLTSDKKVENEKLMLYVGVAGLVINLIGLVLLRGHAHGHSHGGHSHGGHSHGGHSHEQNDVKIIVSNPADGSVPSENSKEVILLNPQEENTKVESDSENEEVDVDVIRGRQKLKSSAQLNMRGVFLHVLGDALGSVIVIISALLIMFIEGDWKYKFDPAMSIVLVIIILSTTIPLLKEAALILLQTVPTHIQVASLKDKLVKKVSGVLAVHEFHVWQLAGNRIIASAHIRCQNLRDYMRIAEEVKSFFHHEGIHSTTIQPEFVEFEKLEAGDDCLLECGPDKTCHVDTCCARSKTPQAIQPKQLSPTPSLRQRSTGGNENELNSVVTETAENKV